DRVGLWRESPRSFDTTGRGRPCRHTHHRNHPDQAAARGARIRRDQRCRRRDFFGLACRHVVRVRLSRRRRPSLRPQDARCGFHPGIPGAADRADHERPHHAVVLLARSPAGRAWHGVAVGAHAWRRRRGRAFHRGQHLPRHGGGAAVRPPLPHANDAQRIIPGHDRRHGGYRRHRAGALYATLLAPLIPDAAAHFVIASVLGAPAAILISMIMVPETSDQRTGGALEDPDLHASSTMDAIVKGTTAGLELLLNIIAMLIVRVALVYLANAVLGLLPNIGGAGISLQRILGLAMAPACWLMGLPWPQAITAGSLKGTKTVLNELIAYVDLSKLGPDALDPRSRLIMLYAMCGFANFASLGIMIGGLGTMAPARRDEINSPGLKLIVSGTLTTCLMGAIVGVMT